MRKTLTPLISAVLLATSATASVKMTGWYKPAAGYGQFKKDWRECERLSWMRGPHGNNSYNSMMVRKCMVTKGYTKSPRGFFP